MVEASLEERKLLMSIAKSLLKTEKEEIQLVVKTEHLKAKLPDDVKNQGYVSILLKDWSLKNTKVRKGGILLKTGFNGKPFTQLITTIYKVATPSFSAQIVVENNETTK